MSVQRGHIVKHIHVRYVSTRVKGSKGLQKVTDNVSRFARVTFMNNAL